MMIEQQVGMARYVVYVGEECFIFQLGPDGSGFFSCTGLAQRLLEREGKKLLIHSKPVQVDPAARTRFEHLEKEFSFSATLDPVLTEEIWDLQKPWPAPMPPELTRRHLVLNAALGYIAVCRCAIEGVDLNQLARPASAQASLRTRFRTWRRRILTAVFARLM